MKFLNFLVLLLVLVPCMAANGITNAEKTLAVHNATSYQATYNAEIPMRPSLYRRVTNQVSAFVESDAATKALRMLDIRKIARKAYFGLAELVQSFMESYSELFSKRISSGEKGDGRAADAQVFAQNSIGAQSFPTDENDSGIVEVDSTESLESTESAPSGESAADHTSAQATIEQTSTIRARAEEGALAELLSLAILYCLFLHAIDIMNRIRACRIGTRTIRRIARKIRAIRSALFALEAATVEGQQTSNSGFPTESQYVFDIVHIDLTRESQAIVDYEPVPNVNDVDAALQEGFGNGHCEEPLTFAMIERLMQPPTLEYSFGYADDEMSEDDEWSDGDAEQHQDSATQQLEPEQNDSDAEESYYEDEDNEDEMLAQPGVNNEQHGPSTPQQLEPEQNDSDDEESYYEDEDEMLAQPGADDDEQHEFSAPQQPEPGPNDSDDEESYYEDEDNEDEMLAQPGADDNEQHGSTAPQQPEPEQNVNEEETMGRISRPDTGNEEPCLGASNVSDEVLIDEFAPEIYRVDLGGIALEIFGASQRALSSYHYGATDITEQAWALSNFLPFIHQISGAVSQYLTDINEIAQSLIYIKGIELKYDPRFDTERIENLQNRVLSLILSQDEKDLAGLAEEIMFVADLYDGERLSSRRSRVRHQWRVRKTYNRVTAIVKKNVETMCANEAPENIFREYCDIVGELEYKICTDELFRQLYADKLD